MSNRVTAPLLLTAVVLALGQGWPLAAWQWLYDHTHYNANDPGMQNNPTLSQELTGASTFTGLTDSQGKPIPVPPLVTGIAPKPILP